MMKGPFACFQVPERAMFALTYGAPLKYVNETEPFKKPRLNEEGGSVQHARPVICKMAEDGQRYALIPRKWDDETQSYGDPWMVPEGGVLLEGGIPKLRPDRVPIPEDVRFFYADPYTVAYDIGIVLRAAFTIRRKGDPKNRCVARAQALERLDREPIYVTGEKNPYRALQHAWDAAVDTTPGWKSVIGEPDISWTDLWCLLNSASHRWDEHHPPVVTLATGVTWVPEKEGGKS